MPFIVPLTPKEARLAGRIGAMADLESVRLLDSSFTFRPADTAKPKSRGGGGREYEVSVSTSERGQLRDAALAVTITFRISCVALVGREGVEIFHSKCSFRLDYLLPKGLGASPREIRAFSKTNALLNAWPYWRELIHGMAARAGMPPVVTPLLKMVPKRSDDLGPRQTRARGRATR